MLCNFSFKNFKSYKEETEFDFHAVSIPEFGESIIGDKKVNGLLPVSVIYGPNAGGKTNLLQAFACMVSLVVKPVKELGKTRNNFILQHGVDCNPFLFDSSSKEQPTEFRVYFRKDDNEYRYYVAVFHGEIVSECLHWRTIGAKKTGRVFEREGVDIELGASFKREKVNVQVNPKMPYLSFLAINYDYPMIAEVVSWFESCVIQSYAISKADSKIFLFDDFDIKKRIITALNDLDIDILDYSYDKKNEQLYTKRSIDGKEYELSFDNESDGTKKLLATLPIILIALHEGRVVVVDELDAKLHPKLLKYIVKLFKNPEINKKGAQLIFTSHDLTTMKNTVFRRDEIWFAAIDNNHGSKIYSLYDIRDENDKHVNSTASYSKQYMEGRYGADPYLQNMLGGEWN